MGLEGGQRPRLTCDRCGRPTWRLYRTPAGWLCPTCRRKPDVARRVIVSDPDTDCATGHCECSACGGAIDPWDAFCKRCGRRLEDA